MALEIAGQASAQVAVSARSPLPDFGIGTVQTVAGPGFCVNGRGRRDPSSLTVRSLAVHADGSLHFETGPAADPVVAQVDVQGRAKVIRLDLKRALGRRTSSLAADGAGGVVVAAGDKLLHVDALGAGVTTLPTRFNSIQAIGSDEAGDLFVADKVTGGPFAFQIQKLDKAGVVKGVPVPKGAGVVSAIAAVGDKLYFATDRGVQMRNLGDKPLTAHGLKVEAGASIDVSKSFQLGLGPLPPGLAGDTEGNLFLSDESNDRVIKLDASGRAGRFAGVGRPQKGAIGNGEAASKALLHRPFDVKAGPGGRIYISDQLNNQIRFVDSNGLIAAAPGAGTGATWECESTPASANRGNSRVEEGFPSGLAAGPKGDFFVISALSGKVIRFGPEGRSEVVAGGPGPTSLVKPTSLAATPEGLYILEGDQFRIRFLNLSSRRPTKANGVAVAPGSMKTVLENYRSDQPVSQAPQSLRDQTAGQQFLATSTGGSLFVGDTRDHRILEMDKTGAVGTIAGQGGPEALKNCCGRLGGLATDRSGNVYFSDGGSSHIWILNRQAGQISAYGQTVAPGALAPVAGAPVVKFTDLGGDGGPALEAHFLAPSAVALDGRGALYVTQEYDSTVRKIDPSGTISTVAGSGTAGFNGDGLKARLTTFNVPGALAVDSCDNLLIADPLNDRIRRLNVNASCRPTTARGGGPDGVAKARPWRAGPALYAIAVAMLTAALGGVVLGRRRYSGPQ